MTEKKYNRQHFKLKYCTTCQYVWENSYCNSKSTRTIYKYKELSSYKLERQQCTQCERNKNAEINTGKHNKKLGTQYC